MKIKYYLVSSFDYLCGNATYSEAIASGLNQQFNVIKINLPIALQKSGKSPRFIEQLTSIKKSNIDHNSKLNIQFEFGLFGPNPTKAIKNLLKVIKIFKKNEFKTVTMHRVDIFEHDLLRSCWNSFKKNKRFNKITGLLETFKNYISARAYSKVIRIFGKYNFKFIVHSHNEKEKILSILNYQKNIDIKVFPITWPDLKFKKKVDIKSMFVKSLPIVSLIGFVSPYKNYDLVLNCLANYRNFNLLICGGMHPASPQYGREKTYIKNLQDLILKYNLDDFVVWVKYKDDNRMIDCFRQSDITLIPYLETGQSGSGIASLAIQNSKNVIFSDTTLAENIQPFVTGNLDVYDVASIQMLNHFIENYKTLKNIQFKKEYSFSNMIDLYANYK